METVLIDTDVASFLSKKSAHVAPLLPLLSKRPSRCAA